MTDPKHRDHLDHLLRESTAFGQTTHDSVVVSIDLDHNGLGTATPETVRALRHASGHVFVGESLAPLNNENYDTAVREYLAQIRHADPSGVQARIFLAYLSGYFHELRHAHDLMSTVYGQEVLWGMAQLYVNAPKLLGALVEWQQTNPDRAIPLPLKHHIHELTGLRPEIVELVNRYTTRQREIGSFRGAPEYSQSELTVTHLLEMSATNTQLAFLYEMFGIDAADELMEIISSGPSLGLYLQAINETRDILLSRTEQVTGVSASINYLAWASLMALTTPNGDLRDGISPVAAFEAFVEYLARRSGDWSLGSVRTGVASFCASWGLETPEGMAIKYQNKMTERMVMLEAKTEAEDFAVWFREFQQGFDAMQAETTGRDFYFRGDTYPWLLFSRRLPAVPVRLRVDGGVYNFMSLGSAKLSVDGWLDRDTQALLSRILIDGLGTSGDPRRENEVMVQLAQQTWTGGHRLRFHDRSLFD